MWYKGYGAPRIEKISENEEGDGGIGVGQAKVLKREREK